MEHNELVEIVEDLVFIEMDMESHDDKIKDYDCELDFYLSNVLDESYMEYFLPEYLDNEASYEEMENIKNLVIEAMTKNISK